MDNPPREGSSTQRFEQPVLLPHPPPKQRLHRQQPPRTLYAVQLHHLEGTQILGGGPEAYLYVRVRFGGREWVTSFATVRRSLVASPMDPKNQELEVSPAAAVSDTLPWVGRSSTVVVPSASSAIPLTFCSGAPHPTWLLPSSSAVCASPSFFFYWSGSGAMPDAEFVVCARPAGVVEEQRAAWQAHAAELAALLEDTEGDDSVCTEGGDGRDTCTTAAAGGGRRGLFNFPTLLTTTAPTAGGRGGGDGEAESLLEAVPILPFSARLLSRSPVDKSRAITGNEEDPVAQRPVQPSSADSVVGYARVRLDPSMLDHASRLLVQSVKLDRLAQGPGELGTPAASPHGMPPFHRGMGLQRSSTTNSAVPAESYTSVRLGIRGAQDASLLRRFGTLGCLHFSLSATPASSIQRWGDTVVDRTEQQASSVDSSRVRSVKSPNFMGEEEAEAERASRRSKDGGNVTAEAYLDVEEARLRALLDRSTAHQALRRTLQQLTGSTRAVGDVFSSSVDTEHSLGKGPTLPITQQHRPLHEERRVSLIAASSTPEPSDGGEPVRECRASAAAKAPTPVMEPLWSTAQRCTITQASFHPLDPILDLEDTVGYLKMKWERGMAEAERRLEVLQRVRRLPPDSLAEWWAAKKIRLACKALDRKAMSGVCTRRQAAVRPCDEEVREGHKKTRGGPMQRENCGRRDGQQTERTEVESSGVCAFSADSFLRNRGAHLRCLLWSGYTGVSLHVATSSLVPHADALSSASAAGVRGDVKAVHGSKEWPCSAFVRSPGGVDLAQSVLWWDAHRNACEYAHSLLKWAATAWVGCAAGEDDGAAHRPDTEAHSGDSECYFGGPRKRTCSPVSPTCVSGSLSAPAAEGSSGYLTDEDAEVEAIIPTHPPLRHDLQAQAESSMGCATNTARPRQGSRATMLSLNASPERPNVEMSAAEAVSSALADPRHADGPAHRRVHRSYSHGEGSSAGAFQASGPTASPANPPLREMNAETSLTRASIAFPLAPANANGFAWERLALHIADEEDLLALRLTVRVSLAPMLLPPDANGDTPPTRPSRKQGDAHLFTDKSQSSSSTTPPRLSAPRYTSPLPTVSALRRGSLGGDGREDLTIPENIDAKHSAPTVSSELLQQFAPTLHHSGSERMSRGASVRKEAAAQTLTAPVTPHTSFYAHFPTEVLCVCPVDATTLIQQLMLFEKTHLRLDPEAVGREVVHSDGPSTTSSRIRRGCTPKSVEEGGDASAAGSRSIPFFFPCYSFTAPVAGLAPLLHGRAASGAAGVEGLHGSLCGWIRLVLRFSPSFSVRRLLALFERRRSAPSPLQNLHPTRPSGNTNVRSSMMTDDFLLSSAAPQPRSTPPMPFRGDDAKVPVAPAAAVAEKVAASSKGDSAASDHGGSQVILKSKEIGMPVRPMPAPSSSPFTAPVQRFFSASVVAALERVRALQGRNGAPGCDVYGEVPAATTSAVAEAEEREGSCPLPVPPRGGLVLRIDQVVSAASPTLAESSGNHGVVVGRHYLAVITPFSSAPAATNRLFTTKGEPPLRPPLCHDDHAPLPLFWSCSEAAMRISSAKVIDGGARPSHAASSAEPLLLRHHHRTPVTPTKRGQQMPPQVLTAAVWREAIFSLDTCEPFIGIPIRVDVMEICDAVSSLAEVSLNNVLAADQDASLFLHTMEGDEDGSAALPFRLVGSLLFPYDTLPFAGHHQRFHLKPPELLSGAVDERRTGTLPRRPSPATSTAGHAERATESLRRRGDRLLPSLSVTLSWSISPELQQQCVWLQLHRRQGESLVAFAISAEGVGWVYERVRHTGLLANGEQEGEGGVVCRSNNATQRDANSASEDKEDAGGAVGLQPLGWTPNLELLSSSSHTALGMPMRR